MNGPLLIQNENYHISSLIELKFDYYISYESINNGNNTQCYRLIVYDYFHHQKIFYDVFFYKINDNERIRLKEILNIIDNND